MDLERPYILVFENKYYVQRTVACALLDAYDQCGDTRESCRALLGSMTRCRRLLKEVAQMVWTRGESERNTGKHHLAG